MQDFDRTEGGEGMSETGDTFQDRLDLRRKLTGKELTPKETIQAYADELCRVANDRDRLRRELACEKSRIAQTVTDEQREAVKRVIERAIAWTAKPYQNDPLPEGLSLGRAAELFVDQLLAALQEGEKG